MRSAFGVRIVGLVLLVVALAAAPAAMAEGPASVAKLARELSPAVVNISSSHKISSDAGVPFPQAPEGSDLNNLFNNLNPNNGEGDQMMQEARSLGSGFIISADGEVVTNEHVIDGADEILVYLTDGTRLKAKVLGIDKKTDLAVLKVDAGHPLPFVDFGNSDQAQVGDWVMAIGNPFGLGGSVTLGIVSARNRDINSGPYDAFIQTDAAINQGNSGGPLFDMNGKVIGINTAIVARGGSSLGIGFAVPANMAKPVVDQLLQYGETRRGWLGVGIQEVTEDIASSMGWKNTDGALVIEVMEGGPSQGVLRDGDLILSFDGKPIKHMHDLPRIVANTPVGKLADVKVLRGGVEQDFKIQLGRLELGEKMMAKADANVSPDGAAAGNDQPDLAAGQSPSEAASVDLSHMVGLKIGPLTDKARSDYAIAKSVKGVLITDVDNGSDAAAKGLLSGYVIEGVNEKPTPRAEDVASLVGAAREAGRPAVVFKVVDPAGMKRFIAVKLN